MKIELNVELKKKSKITNKQKQDFSKPKDKEYPYKWEDDGFDNDIFKNKCNELNEKLKEKKLTNVEIFQNLLMIKDQALRPITKGGNTTTILYSEETR
ncbi:MAG: hypothetical protein AAGK05_19675, partial [Pseudomonadota bacterium]